MQRRDVALAIGLGLLLAGTVIAINDYRPDSPIGWAVGLANRFWYFGVGAVLVAAVLAWRDLSGSAARLIGFAGLLWVSFLAGGQLLGWLSGAMAGPQGP